MVVWFHASQIINTGLFQSAIFFPAHRLAYCALPVSSAQPKATLSRGPGKAVASGAVDTLFIEYDQAIITAPTVAFDPATAGTDGPVVKVDDNNFYVLYTAGGTYTGLVEATVSGATSDDSGVLLTQADETIDMEVDNEVPVLVSSDYWGGSVGRNQFTTITMTFNEAIATAPKITATHGSHLDACH